MPLLDATVDEEAMVRVAVAAVDQKCGSGEQPQVEDAIRRDVHQLFEHARIKAYVGVIAGRHALEALRAERAA
jgi:hypothetical protein